MTTAVANGASSTLLDTGLVTIAETVGAVTLEVTQVQDLAIGTYTVTVTSGFSLYPTAASPSIGLWPIDVAFKVISCATEPVNWSSQGTYPASDAANNLDVDVTTFSSYTLFASAAFENLPCYVDHYI